MTGAPAIAAAPQARLAHAKARSQPLARSASSVALLAMSALHAQASPLTVTNTYQFLDNAGFNNIGIAPGPRQQLGSNCVVLVGNPCTPQNTVNAAGTSGVATQSGSPARTMQYVASDLTSNHWAFVGSPSSLPDGAWTLTFSNGTDQTTAQTPALVGAQQMAFADAAGIQQNGTTPTFSWALPLGQSAPVDSVNVLIRDISDFRNGVATIIFSSGAMAPSNTTLTVAPNDPRFQGGRSLEFGKLYALEIQLRDTRNNQPTGGFSNTLSQSRTYLNFSLQTGGPQGIVYLPSVDGSGPVPVYHFSNIPVVAGRTIYIDPEVAVGFDYKTASGDPNFRSVTLPTGIGDNLFDLWLWDGAAWVDTGNDLLGGQEFMFGSLGVDRFRITGIEPDELLDPYAAGAFTTGLSFVADGRFSGTMTPLVVNLVPEPPTGLLGIAAIGLLAAARRRRLRSASR